MHAVRVLLVVLALALPASVAVAQPPELLVHEARRLAGVPHLLPDPVLTAAAERYAAHMATIGSLAHRDAYGRDAAARVRDAGGTISRVGEVLGAGPTVRAVVHAWQESPAHRRVMLRSQWTHLGIGTAIRGDARVVVALFARRLHELVDVRVRDDTVVLSGRCLAAGIPVALTLSRLYRPTILDEATGRWEMLFPLDSVPLTLRLGVMHSDGTVETAHVVYPRAAVEAP